MTMWTPLSLNCAIRLSLTVDVMMVLPASSSAPKSSSSCTGATTTVASRSARRSTKFVHSLTGADAIRRSGVQSST